MAIQRCGPGVPVVVHHLEEDVVFASELVRIESNGKMHFQRIIIDFGRRTSCKETPAIPKRGVGARSDWSEVFGGLIGEQVQILGAGIIPDNAPVAAAFSPLLEMERAWEMPTPSFPNGNSAVKTCASPSQRSDVTDFIYVNVRTSFAQYCGSPAFGSSVNKSSEANERVRVWKGMVQV